MHVSPGWFFECVVLAADAAEVRGARYAEVPGPGRAGAQDRNAGGDAGASQQRCPAERHAQGVRARGGGGERPAGRRAASQAGGPADPRRRTRGLGVELPERGVCSLSTRAMGLHNAPCQFLASRWFSCRRCTARPQTTAMWGGVAAVWFVQ